MLHNKTLISLICVIGIVAVSYGMLNDNNLVFIIGLLFVIGGYLGHRIQTAVSEFLNCFIQALLLSAANGYICTLFCHYVLLF